MSQFSSAADMHPGAPKTVQGNAALMDEREPTYEELRKIETALYPPGSKFSEEEYNKRHNLTNPYKIDRHVVANKPPTKRAEDKASISWPDYPVRKLSDPETPTNPNPKNIFGTKISSDAGNEDLFSQTKVSGGGGNSGAVISPSPFGGLSAYQDANTPVHRLPKRQSGGI
jgi:hypothetical protein